MDTSEDTAFTEEQFALPYPDGVQRHYWYRARNKIIERRLSRYLTSARSDLILEIGCGRGIVVEYFREIGWNVVGCDLGRPTPMTPELAPFLTLGVNAFDLPIIFRRSVKFILLLDVLEHMEAPDKFISKCLEAFPICEVLFATFPARMELWSNYDEHYGHFMRYDRSSVAALAQRSGWKLLTTGYFFHGLYVPALLLHLLNIKRGLAMKAPKSLFSHRLLSAFFNFEERILPSFLMGSSLYAAFGSRRK